MCVAGIHVTTAPCSHRWYSLIRSCSQANNLANCPEKLKLEGWEHRHEICPFCSGENTESVMTHRLFGSTSSASSSSVTSPIPGATMDPGRMSRRGSAGTINGAALSPLSRQSSTASSMENERAQRSRDMNDRIHAYLSSDPHEVLPSAKKYYPTYSSISESADDSNTNTTSSSASVQYINRKRSSISRGWKRMSSKFMLKPV